MNEDMVERVARAINPSAWSRRVTNGPAKEARKNMARDAARAAIEAMREPTEAMLEAARLAPTPAVYLDSERARVHLGVKTEWQAMISTALMPRREG